MQLPMKQVTPVSKKKSASVAAIFKQHAQHTKDDVSRTGRLARKPPRHSAKSALDKTTQSFKSGSSSHSPQKAKNASKKSDMHPLAVAFKGTSDEYRRHLYKSNILKIDTALDALVRGLYENSLQIVSSDATNGTDSPIRLTFPARFEREAVKLYQPISAYKLGLTRTNRDGTRTKIMSTLEARMMDYEDYTAKHRAEVQKLKNDWETIVGEIWKIGVQCLGEEVMESMLFTDKAATELSSSPIRVESTLFVPEQGTSTPPRTTRNKKRVTFETPVSEKDAPSSTKDALHFLYQPTRLRLAPVPTLPSMPKQELVDLETRIKELGQKELTDYMTAERDYRVYWQKKNERLAQVLVED